MWSDFGADTFVFKFTFDEVKASVIVEAGMSITLAAGTIVGKPSLKTALQAWQNWDAAVDQFVQEQLAANGWTMTDELHALVSSTNKIGGALDVTNGFNWKKSEQTMTAQGHDTIKDFGAGDAPSFVGLSSVKGATNHWSDWLSLTYASGDTTISVAGGQGGSITLEGYRSESLTLADMVANGLINFNLPMALSTHADFIV